jgi:uncharacterized protein YbjT (DUF2867 family)
VTPHGRPDEVEQGLSIVAAAEQAGLPHLVLWTVASAAEAPQVPHFARRARIEAAGRASPVATSVVAPTWFLDNVLGTADALRSGELALALSAGRRLPAVALVDLGRLVADRSADPPRRMLATRRGGCQLRSAGATVSFSGSVARIGAPAAA